MWHAAKALLLCAAICLGTNAAGAADYPVKNGPVWKGWYAHVDETKMTQYLDFLNRVHRLELEALKKEGLIIGYQIIVSEARSPQDWNLGIIVEYKDMAALNLDLARKAEIEKRATAGVPDLAKLEADHFPMREMIGSRIFREVEFSK